MDVPLNDEDLVTILNAIERRTGIATRPDQRDAARVTIRRAMRRVNISRPSELVHAFQYNAAVYQEIVNEVTIGETYFFREPKQFEFIRNHIISDLRSREGASAPMRAWSAACASGEEAYSLAIVCDLMKQPVNILATDVAPDAVAAARKATYRDWSFRGEAMTHVKPYLIRDGEVLRLKDSIKQKVRFQLLNLYDDVYPSLESGTQNLDLVMCRNVLIYFGPRTVTEVGQRLFRCLRPGGWLITASGDPSLDHIGGFAVTATDYGTFYQRPLEGKASDSVNSGVELRRNAKPSPATAPRDTPVSVSSEHRENHSVRRRGERDGSAVRSSGRGARVTDTDQLPAAKEEPKTPETPEACVVSIQAASRSDSALALDKCTAAIARHPLSNELHFLKARLLMEADRLSEASQTAQKALFLDRSAVMVHFLFGSIELQRGQLDSAHRHFRNARQLCDRYRPGDVVPFTDNETAAELTAALDSQLKQLRAQSG